MKKIILFLILILFLSSCGVFNLNDFVLPDDIDFIETIETLNTPEKICAYMKDNFEYKAHAFYAPDPYTLWKTQKGDCNDFATFAIFIAHYHGYETYQIRIFYKNTFSYHVIAVFKENNKYNFSHNQGYFFVEKTTFKEIVLRYFFNYELKSYKVFDYDMNLIEQNYASW